jgi:hypothetical protein
MKGMGMEFNTGNTPPIIEGEYLVESILDATNIPSDVLGSSFIDAVLTFEEQDNKNLSVRFLYDQTIESGEGIGALIAGKNNLFSVLLKVSGETHNSPTQSAMVISEAWHLRELRIFNGLFLCWKVMELPMLLKMVRGGYLSIATI